MTPIRVLLADDHGLVRAGMRRLLESIPDIAVIGEAGTGSQALQQARQGRPDVVLMDITMPDMTGLEALARLKQELPRVRVLILSMHDEEAYVTQALQAGADGYLLKDSATAELEIAVRAVAAAEMYLSPAVSRYVVASYLRVVYRVAGEQQRLTPRQREILHLVAQGYTNRQIAGLLTISTKTVEAHRAQLMERLNTHDVTGLVRIAMRMGLIPGE